jgi:hypothetical protein
VSIGSDNIAAMSWTPFAALWSTLQGHTIWSLLACSVDLLHVFAVGHLLIGTGNARFWRTALGWSSALLAWYIVSMLDTSGVLSTTLKLSAVTSNVREI